MGQTKNRDNDSAASDLQSGHNSDIEDKRTEGNWTKSQDDVTSDLQGECNDDTQNGDSKKKHKCTYPECHAAFLRPSRLKRHMRMHTGERPYVCKHPGCTKSYTNTSHLKRHLEMHKSIKKVYQCKVCSTTISNLYNLKRHYKRMHDEDKKLSCQECGETFHKKYQLVQHQTKHFGPTTYKCDKCTKTYTNPNRFKRHEKTHERGYPCSEPECSEVFNKWLLLYAHRKAKHITNYKCENCDKVFPTKFKLKVHSKIHSKDRLVIPCPYDNCQKAYLFKFNLQQHIRVKHEGEKFYCDICSAEFTMKQKLVKHIQRHLEPQKEEKNKSNKDRRRKRKDTGIPKKSILTGLVGIKLPYNLEKMVMERGTTVKSDNDNIKIS